MPGYQYSASEEGAWVHLYAQGRARIAFPGGGELALTQETRYPWDGDVALRIDEAPAGPLSLFLRIPSWCPEAVIKVNGQRAEGKVRPGSYREIRREWRAGDRLELSLPMPVRLVECHPRVSSNRGRVAVMRGPLVYCIEGTDHPGIDVGDISLPAGARWTAEFRPDLLGGVTVLKTEGRARESGGWGPDLYRERRPGGEGEGSPVPIVAIPYYAWANREPGPMQVWIPVDERGE